MPIGKYDVENIVTNSIGDIIRVDYRDGSIEIPVGTITLNFLYQQDDYSTLDNVLDILLSKT